LTYTYSHYCSYETDRQTYRQSKTGLTLIFSVLEFEAELDIG